MAAAVVAAVKEAAEVPFSLPVKPAGAGLGRSPGRSNGKVVVLGKSSAGSFTVGGSNGYPSPPSSLPTQGPFSTNEVVGSVGGAAQNLQFPRKTGSFENGSGDSAIAEGYGPEGKGLGRRRASEGAHVVLGGPEGSTSGRGSRARSGSELKCEKCGKGYKHSSCLTKHLFVLPSSIYLFFPGFARTRITFYFSYPTLCISELFISSSRILARYLPFFNSTLRKKSNIYPAVLYIAVFNTRPYSFLPSALNQVLSCRKAKIYLRQYIDGNTHRNGLTRPNFLSPSTSKSSFSKRLQSWSR